MWLAPIEKEEQEQFSTRWDAKEAAQGSDRDFWSWKHEGQYFLAARQKGALLEALARLSLHKSARKLQDHRKAPLLTSKEFHDRTIIALGEQRVGSQDFVVMAGPCTLEVPAKLQELFARFPAKRACDSAALRLDLEDPLLQPLAQFFQKLRTQGVRVVRAGCYKPRTSPYAFDGLGLEGYILLGRLCRHFGLMSVSEVLDERSLEEAHPWIDLFQIGARNMHNMSLLRHVAAYERPVLLKRGLCATYEEWLFAAECLLAKGSTQVMLCERGIRTFNNEVRFTLDLQALCVLKEQTHLPIIVDPSHAAGKRSWVPAMARAALAAGADGLLVEVHPEPDKALCDGKQSMSLEQFSSMQEELEKIAPCVGKRIKK